MRRIFIITALAGLIITNALNAQECSKLKIFDKDKLADFDYRGQSSFATLSSGDTAKIKIVVYSGQEYRILVGGENKFGQIPYRIVDEQRLLRREVKEITKNEIPVYKLDADGNPVLNEWGEYILDHNDYQYDTIYESVRYVERKEIFNSAKAGDVPYYEIVPKKTRVYIIEVLVPKSEPPLDGCVMVMVGFRQSKKKPSFKSF